jgi:cell wall-associated NlpC family hydrolase
MSAVEPPRHWSEQFLGVSYEQGAQGPDAYDCWSHFRWVQREQFGRDVAFVPSPRSRGTTARILPVLATEFGWKEVDAPSTGDGVLLSYWKMPSHVGVYVDDARAPSVLHCPQGGAALHSLFHLKAAGWRLRAYYRYLEHA